MVMIVMVIVVMDGVIVLNLVSWTNALGTQYKKILLKTILILMVNWWWCWWWW